jgi:hypothetical protein
MTDAASKKKRKNRMELTLHFSQKSPGTQLSRAFFAAFHSIN